MTRRLITVVTATLAAAMCSTVAAAGTRTSGVTGRVTAGPTCPVERVDHPCPPQPVSATIKAQKTSRTFGRRCGSSSTIKAQKTSRTFARTRSDANGDYSMRLAPGRYTLVVQTGSLFPRCPATAVTVPRNQVVTADISCDTGIR